VARPDGAGFILKPGEVCADIFIMSVSKRTASSLLAIKQNILSRYYKVGNTYQVFFGPLRGVRLFYDGQISFGEIAGLYDRRTFDILSRIFIEGELIQPEMTIADVGANVGIYSILFSKLISSDASAKIFAFEPNPTTADLLEKHVGLNHINNIEVVRSALSDKVGTGQFYSGAFHKTSSLIASHGNGTKNTSYRASPIMVSMTTFDDFFVKQGREVPDFIKLDIEGAAGFALSRCGECLSRKRPSFLIESHDPNEDQAIGSFVTNWGYAAYRLEDQKWVTNPSQVYPHPDGIWGHLILIPEDLRQKVSKVLRIG